MKSTLKLLSALGLIIFSVSCGDDEKTPEANPIVGSWVIDTYLIENVPDAYSNNEGSELSSLFGEDSYVLEVLANGTYNRALSFSSPSEVFDESGEWLLEENSFLLDPTGSGIGLDNDFEVLKSTKTDLRLSIEVNFSLVPDIYFDTVTDQYRNYLQNLSNEEFDSVYSNVLTRPTLVDLVFDFDLKR